MNEAWATRDLSNLLQPETDASKEALCTRFWIVDGKQEPVPRCFYNIKKPSGPSRGTVCIQEAL